jgi:hypothetical protein
MRKNPDRSVFSDLGVTRTVLLAVLLLILLILLLAGLVMAGGGVYLALKPDIPKAFTATASATVTGFGRSYQTKTGGRTAFVAYTVNGTGYRATLNDPDSDLQAGASIEIRYDTRNPERSAWAEERVLSRVFWSMVVTAIGIGLLALVAWAYRQIRQPLRVQH